MSLKSYCEENNRLRILREWDTEKNLPPTLDAVAHTSATPRLVALRKRSLLVYADPQPLQKLHRLPQML